jgi:hypothetical protein
MIPRRVLQDLAGEPGARQILDDQHGRPAVSAQRPTAMPGPHSGTMIGASGTSLPSLPVHGCPRPHQGDRTDRRLFVPRLPTLADGRRLADYLFGVGRQSAPHAGAEMRRDGV